MTDSLPRISIITIVRNGGRTLTKAIESIVQQHYPNLEYIVIDGGSTDNTLDIIRDYQSHIHYWHSKPDRGGNDAYNIGLQFATGDLVGFLNADDWYESGILEKVANVYLETDYPEIVTCQAKLVKQVGDRFVTQAFFNKTDTLALSVENMLFHMPLLNARFYKKSLLEKIGAFHSHDHLDQYCISADRDWLLRMAMADASNVVLDCLGYTYLIHAGSQTMSACPRTMRRVFREHIDLCWRYFRGSPGVRWVFGKWFLDQVARWVYFEIKRVIRFG